MHPDLLGKAVALARIAGTARRHHVRPIIRATARQRNEVVARERLAVLELRDVSPAVLAPIMVAREQERVRHLPAEAPRHMNELRETDDGGPGHREALRPHDTIEVRLDDLGFAVDHETKRPT